MQDLKLTAAELNLADMIWERSPVRSSDLVSLCAESFDWKKSTTYTILKRLEEKGVFHNDNGIVITDIDKDDFYSRQTKIFVDETFGGSLPRFLTAFARGSRLNESEVDQLRRLIDSFDADRTKGGMQK